MAQTAFILILGDPQRGARLGELLRGQHRHACNAVTQLDDALASMRNRAPDVVVADGLEASELATLAGALDGAAEDATLVIIDQRPVELPARGFQVKRLGPELDDAALARAIDAAATQAVMRRQDRLMRRSLEEHRDAVFEGIVGASPRMRAIFERVRRAASNKLTVLIIGETGVGKELIAEAIHRRSARARKRYIAVSCADFSETLLESALFGHVRGAYTGAVSDSKGIFAAADGGTLFLDEVSRMPLNAQSKLLRVLDRREFMPVGSTDLVRVDVRVIAASNRDLREAIDKGEFMPDLYYRLHEIEIRVPPLRERRDDIPLLAHHLLQQANRDHDLRVPGISSEAMAYLTRNFWPGNVRELRNIIVRTASEVVDRQIEADDLPEEIRGSREIVPVTPGGFVGMTWDQIERLVIERTLQATGGNREQAAKMLNIGTRTLYRKIKEFGL